MALLTLSPACEILAVGLDVDGVVRDTGYKAYEAMCKTLAEMKGIVPSFDMFVHGYTTDPVAFFAECGVDKSRDQIYKVYNRHYPENHHRREPYADVTVFLEKLKTLGLKVFAVSGHPHQQILEWFEHHQLDVYFDHVNGGSNDKSVHLAAACAQLGVPVQSACYVGDWGADMRAAAQVQMIPIGITRGYDSRDALLRSGAAYVVDHLEDLMAAIN